jgi:hypothetical protein
LMARNTESDDILRAGFDTTFDSSVPPLAETFPEWLRIALSGRPVLRPKRLSKCCASVMLTDFHWRCHARHCGRCRSRRGAPLPPNAFLSAAASLIESGAAPTLLNEVGLFVTELANGADPSAAAAVIAPMFNAVPAQRAQILTTAILAADDVEIRAAIAAAAVAADPPHAAEYLDDARAADPDTADDAAIEAACAAASGLSNSTDGPGWKDRSGGARANLNSSRADAFRRTRRPDNGAETNTGGPCRGSWKRSGFHSQQRSRDCSRVCTCAGRGGKLAALEAADESAPGTTLSMLFDVVENEVLAHRIDVESITAATVIASPRYAHHTLHAAAFRYPGAALKVVQASFANGL